MFNATPPNATDLAFDLRQRYAKIVGDHMELVAGARLDRNYQEYFRALEDLYVLVRHKFKKPIEDIKRYNKLRSEAIVIANKYPDGWLSKNSNPNELAQIENALRELEMFLYSKMDIANMFGAKRDMEGLS